MSALPRGNSLQGPANRETGGQPRRQSVRRRVLLYGAVVCAVTAIAIWQYLRMRYVSEDDARVMADMVTISSRIDGWIAVRPVTDGDIVGKGQVLVTVDQREIAAQVEELRAKFASTRLDRERTIIQLDMTKKTTANAIATAQARLAEAEANERSAAADRERARQDYERYKASVGKGLVSQQAWEASCADTRKAEERFLAVHAQLDEAKFGLADAMARKSDIEVLELEVARLASDAKQMEAQIQQKEIEFEDRVMRSPVDGVVDQKFVEVGEYVIPGQRLLMIHDPKSVWIEARVKETKLANVKPGQSVTVSVDAYPRLTITGRVERIGNSTTSQFALLPSPNPSGNFTKITQRIPVRIAIDQPADAPLRPGMMVEIEIDTKDG